MKKLLFIILGALLLTSCVEKIQKVEVAKKDTIVKTVDTVVKKDTVVKSKWITDKKVKKEPSNSNDTLTKLLVSNDSLVEYGTASYYDYNTPRITANGSKFNPNALTCAYYRESSQKRKYLNKRIRVCSADTCIILLVSDNGDFRSEKYKHLHRLVDLTPKAFKLLKGSLRNGVMKVKVYY